MDSLNFNSVENLSGLNAKAFFKVNSSAMFKEDVDIVPTIVDDSLSYVPWGGDNQMPFNILDLIEKDETLATCQIFNAEVCFGSGLIYDTALIGKAKEAKLKNHAPIKYQIEISAKYWESIFRAESITDRRKQQERIVKEKQSILDFLTGAENSGKAWFSTFYITPDGKEQHDVVINKTLNL